MLDLQTFQDSRKTIQLFLAGCMGPVRSICVTTDTTLGQAISDICQDDPLQFGVRQLDLDQSLAQLRLRNHDTLHITSRNRGGGKLGSSSKDEGPEKKQSRPSESIRSLPWRTSPLQRGVFCLPQVNMRQLEELFAFQAMEFLPRHHVITRRFSKARASWFLRNSDSWYFPNQQRQMYHAVRWNLQLVISQATDSSCRDGCSSSERSMSNRGRSKICRYLWRTPKLWQSRPFATNGRKSKQFGTSLSIDLRNWSSRHLLSIQQVWGRSWRKNNRPTQPDLAFSFRLWIKVKSALAKEPPPRSRCPACPRSSALSTNPVKRNARSSCFVGSYLEGLFGFKLGAVQQVLTKRVVRRFVG